jgi:uncharacterized RDD family membrane protein YckC
MIIPNSILPIISAWLYWGIMESSKRRSTFGKEQFKLIVLSTDGHQISFLKASARFLGLFINILTFFIGYTIMFFTEKRQCLHDYITYTVVVKEVSRTYNPTNI